MEWPPKGKSQPGPLQIGCRTGGLESSWVLLIWSVVVSLIPRLQFAESCSPSPGYLCLFQMHMWAQPELWDSVIFGPTWLPLSCKARPGSADLSTSFFFFFLAWRFHL